MHRYIFLVTISAIITMQACNETGIIAVKGPVDYVDPMIGTGFHGHTYPGAVVPFGRVQLSPDTRLEGWDASSGYHYSDSTIYGFSHTHLSGTGIGDMGDILFLPFTGDIPSEPVATFSHDNETARPGYYSVLLKPWDINCELSATLRTGWHRYSYPEGSNSSLMIDLGHVLQTTWGHRLEESYINIIDDKTIEGYRLTTGWAACDPVYFRAEFARPFEIIQLEADGKSVPGSRAEGRDVRAWLSFGELSSPLEIKVSVSAVDEQGARVNMQEVSDLESFDRVAGKAWELWSETLASIEIESSDESVLTNFYTAMYHAHLSPMIFSDADGRYVGMDRQIHYETNTRAYTVFSLWDTFRAWYPLMTIIDPSKSREWIYSLYDGYKEGGLLPKWPLTGNYTGTMVGYPALSLLADGMTKGLADSIPEKLLEAAVVSVSWQPDWHDKHKGSRAENVMPEHIMYKELTGIVPVDACVGSVSWGLEMAYYDWCLIQMAKYLGDEQLADEWHDRSLYYRNYYDPSTGFMRARTSDGNWFEGFNPNYSDHEAGEYIEGNFYLPTPEGIIGNEDCGQMSAWYILSALGFYQIAPGNPVYDIGRPVVDGARIRQGDGWFSIKVHNNSRRNKYVERTVLNGQELKGLQFRHEEIKAGGTLEFFMASEPGKLP